MRADIEARVRRANLLTHDDQLESLLGEDLSRRLLRLVKSKKEGRMTDTTSNEQPTSVRHDSTPRTTVPGPTKQTGGGPRRRLALASLLAGFLAVAAIGVVVVLVAGNQEPDVAASPVGIAQSFIGARNESDAERMQSLLAPDARIRGDLVTTADEYVAVAEYERATGWTYVVGECLETGTEASTRVNCTYEWQNDWSRALGIGPAGGNSFGFVISDGQIQELTNNFSLSGFSEAWNAFTAWLEETHPDDIALMMEPTGLGIDAPRLTPESVELWDKYTAEFVAST